MIRRQTLWFAMLLSAMVALAPALAEARAGGGSSSGSRGTRTYNAAPATPTAPQSQPMQRSVTPTQPSRPAAQPAGVPAAQPSFFQRNPFVAGLMGGLIGAGIGGMLFGGGFMGGGMGMAGGLGLLLQLALIGGLAYLAYSFWRRRKEGAASEPSYAYATADDRGPWAARQPDRQIPDVAPIDIGTGRTGGGMAPAAATAVRDEIGVKESDYAEFEKLLIGIQKAWSEGEVAALRRHLTPEMLSYFSEHLSRNASAGIENRVEDVKFENGDLAEAWAEDDLQYATVAMKWTARDYTTRTDTGVVTEGSKTERGEAVEVWTFVRAPGGRWLLSAIQQV
jgi:predicted lipid-binding transport protein (Tim44 family)